MATPDWITNPYLKLYLDYVEDTEAPRIMHVWSIISCASACMARHVYLPFDLGDIYPNIYCLLVGPPATTKSTALKVAIKLLKGKTAVNFAPDDTNGQRQGLITALQGKDETNPDEGLAALDAAGAAFSVTDIENVQVAISQTDKHCLFVAASEFESFIGQNSKEMTTFLIKMWDGDSYDYKLKHSACKLVDPLVTLLGATTSTSIATTMPQEAIGQGFMSRVILVFSSKKYKSVPLRKVKLQKELIPQLSELMAWLSYTMQGAMCQSQRATHRFDELYEKEIELNDSRFMYYTARRFIHLVKLAMILAGLRKSYKIELEDVEQAEMLLALTEENMPDALGEYGLSPIATAKQKLVEFIQFAREPVSDTLLWAVMQRDMKLIDFRNSISELIQAEKIMQVDTRKGKAFIAVDKLDDVEEAIDLLV